MALGILCLETYWSGDVLDRRSVRGLLELVAERLTVTDADRGHAAVANAARAAHARRGR